MEPGAGEHLELSLRAWMCGGAIRVITCSRVAVRNSLRPRHVAEESNYRRIVELWFGEFRGVALRQGGFAAGDMTADDRQLLAQRRTYLQKTVPEECKSINWYLKNVAPMLIAPSDAARHFGKLRAKTGYCVRASDSSGVDVQMAMCREYMYETVATFEMNADGLIFRGDRCLEPDDANGGRLVTWPCSEERGTKQHWRLTDSRLTLASRPDLCLVQVSERDAVSMDLFHYARLQKCLESEADLRKQRWKFLNF